MGAQVGGWVWVWVQVEVHVCGCTCGCAGWVWVWVWGCDGVTLIGSSLSGLSRLNDAPLKKAFVASGEPQMESLPFTLMAAFAELL